MQRPPRGGASRASPQPGSSNSQKPTPGDGMEDEARAGNIALLDELRDRVRKAESASEELQRHLNLMQARLDESQQSQSRLEDRLQQKEVKVEELEANKTQAARQRRDLETLYESERAALFKEKEEQTLREEEMQDTITRLKGSLAQREAKGTSENRENSQQRCELLL